MSNLHPLFEDIMRPYLNPMYKPLRDSLELKNETNQAKSVEAENKPHAGDTKQSGKKI